MGPDVEGPRNVDCFRAELVSDLPEPARRYLTHSLAEGTPFPRGVRLETHFRMKLRAVDRRHRSLFGTEELEVPRSFRWSAKTRIGWLPIRVTDSYADGVGRTEVRLFGLLPLLRGQGPEITRSARGRLAAECLWMPSALARIPEERWTPRGSDRVAVELRIDGEPLVVELRVGVRGALRELEIRRHGNVGVPSWQGIPYGVRVEQERTFEGITIPTRVRGGWWYGTERYQGEDAGVFEVTGVSWRG